MTKVIYILAFFISLQPAAAETFKFSVDKSSKVNFSTKYENDAVTGSFDVFSGEVRFHPDDLENSRTLIRLNSNSVISEYDYAVDTLNTEGWLDPKHFTEIVFESESFKKISDKKYEILGNLRIKDIKKPITLTFTLDEFSKDKATAAGTAKLLRSDYKLGWKETDELQDLVEITFKVNATGIK